MRIKAKLVFRPETIGKLREVFDSIGVKIEEKVDGIAYLYIDDEKYIRLKEELSRLEIEPFELREEQFSDKELDNAEFLYMGPAGYWGVPRPDKRMEDWQKASYDLGTACPKCGFGAIQNRPYLVKEEPKFG